MVGSAAKVGAGRSMSVGEDRGELAFAVALARAPTLEIELIAPMG
jgi:hypothetical protein